MKIEGFRKLKIEILDYILVYPLMIKPAINLIREAKKFQEDIAVLSKVTGLKEKDVIKKVQTLPYTASYIRAYYITYGKFPND